MSAASHERWFWQRTLTALGRVSRVGRGLDEFEWEEGRNEAEGNRLPIFLRETPGCMSVRCRASAELIPNSHNLQLVHRTVHPVPSQPSVGTQ